MRAFLEDVITGRNTGAGSWLVRAALWPLSLVYSLGLWVYLLPYSIGLRKRFRLGVPVISVGNLTFGGTGKTPAVIAICKMLAEAGLRVVVLSRGHGGSTRRPLVVSDGEKILATHEESGDEPLMLAAAMPGVPVVSGRDRRVSGAMAVERFAPDVIVLDDGLQFWQLHRDLDVVVVSAEKPFGSGFLMPAGDLREPPRAIHRAGIVLITSCRAVDAPALEKLKGRLHTLAPHAVIFEAEHCADCLVDACTGATKDAGELDGKQVAAFCGIGSPSSFMRSLKTLGAVTSPEIIFSDHFAYSAKDAKLIVNQCAASEAEIVVTTEKDLARLGPLAGDIPGLLALRVSLEIEGKLRFAQHITNRVHRQD